MPSHAGWCQPCYEQGSFVLATSVISDRCVVHGADGATADVRPERFGLAAPPVARPRETRPSSTPRGRAARPVPPLRPNHGAAARPVRRQLTRAAARALAYGRERARQRLEGGQWAPHPGWRSFIDTGWRVLVDQNEALQRIDELVDGEDWREDKRHSWTQILRHMVCAMDWSTGLVTGLAADRLGAAGARAPRTVSRVLAWARDAGLLVVVEAGASKEFLGTDRNRTPTYALVTCHPQPVAAQRKPPPSRPVDESGDLPESLVGNKPLTGGRRNNPASKRLVDWPVFQIPNSPSERNAAAHCLLNRMGLDGPSSGAPLWRARALLKGWWDQGACVAGVLYALDHHPDRLEIRRGAVTRGSTDVLRVIGYRLKPWTGRLAELPPQVVGHRGDYRARQATHLAARVRVPATGGTQAPDRTSAGQLAARAAWAEHRRALRQRRFVEQRRIRDGGGSWAP
ncbi:MAG: hypothetical protein AB7I38_18735 [Dehalococcoidia bacterium]